MKMKQLEYLIKIAECGSISKAAQELYISQPSLTKAISAVWRRNSTCSSCCANRAAWS